MRKKILCLVILALAFFTLLINKVSAKQVNVYVFYGKGCPHCEAALKYLNSVKDKYDLNLYKYEVWYDNKNQETLSMVSEFLKTEATGVPFVVIDNTAISGYSKNNTDETYRYHIKMAQKKDFVDNVGIKLGVVKDTSLKKQITKKENNMKINLPFLGRVNLKDFSLPIVSIILGLIDGFNPCAMWVLLFLISTLISMKDKKRLWILGITFLVASSAVYLAFMLSWLSFINFIGKIALVRFVIALVALIGGILNIKSYIDSLNKEDGCTVTSDSKRKKIFAKIKKFTHEKSFFIALVGVILLAASVNLIELACSAGIPVIFTQLLSMNNLHTSQYLIYMLIYILFFMLDDLIIFIIAVKTFELTGISTKYSKYSHLIGGLLMLLIGALLALKPEWLMFNF